MKIVIAVVGLVAAALCSGPFLFADEDTHTARVGALGVTVTAVDSGPINVPAAGRGPLQSVQHLVLVRVRMEEMKLETSCTSFTGRLRVDSGEEYEPQETAIGGWRGPVRPVNGIQGEVFFAFLFNERAKPVELTIERDTKADEACAAQSTSHLPPITPQTLTLALEGLPMTQSLAVNQQRQRVIRFGELEVAATTVAIAPVLGGRFLLDRPHVGHHFVVVALKVKNASRHPSCIRFYPTLSVDRGYQYRDEPKGERRPPETYDLLPGWEREGSYAFEVHDGTTPIALVLRRYPELEKVCTGSQHRPVDMSGGAVVRIPLSGPTTPVKGNSE
jgi:hypothetical protein